MIIKNEYENSQYVFYGIQRILILFYEKTNKRKKTKKTHKNTKTKIKTKNHETISTQKK